MKILDGVKYANLFELRATEAASRDNWDVTDGVWAGQRAPVAQVRTVKMRFDNGD
jgi:hypothetical protein